MIKQLSKNWFAEGTIDFEYKKYILLAYLQYVDSNFKDNILYPDLAEIIQHARNLANFLDEKYKLYNQFPKRLQFEVENEVSIPKPVNHDENSIMEEIENIVSFAIPLLDNELSIGKDVYEYIESKLNFEPIGIEPLEKNGGYLFIKNGNQNTTQVYHYQMNIFTQPDATYRSIKTDYYTTYQMTITNTYEAMKQEIIKTDKLSYIPAVYLCYTDRTFPLHESLLPVIKRRLIRYLF